VKFGAAFGFCSVATFTVGDTENVFQFGSTLASVKRYILQAGINKIPKNKNIIPHNL
jgi:hypothetical protein